MSSPLDDARAAAMAGDIDTAVAILSQLSDAAAIDTCHDLVMDLYWKQKNIKGVTAIGKTGITLALNDAANPNNDPTHAATLRTTARKIAYNASSFCWPGWNEPGIELGPEEFATGHELALHALDLVTQYEPKPLTLSRAHWLVGAHMIAAREYDAAIEQFAKSQSSANEAQSHGENLLAQGYTLLAFLLRNPGHPTARERLNAVKYQFRVVPENNAR